MNWQVVWLESAERDMLETAEYILSEFGETTQKKFYRDTFHTAELLGINPNMGRIEPLLADRATTYRSILVNNINKIVYAVKGDTVEISGFWNMRREPKNLADSIK